MNVRLHRFQMKEIKIWIFVSQIWAKLRAEDCKIVLVMNFRSEYYLELRDLYGELSGKETEFPSFQKARGGMDCSVLNVGSVKIATRPVFQNTGVDNDSMEVLALVLEKYTKRRRILRRYCVTVLKSVVAEKGTFQFFKNKWNTFA